MAILTELTPEDLEALSRRYGFSFRSFRGLREGSVNTNYEVTTTSGEKLFARVFEEQTMEGARREAARGALLQRHGVSLPVALETASGERVTELRGKPAALYPFLPGTIRCQRSVRPEDTRAVGAALARVHRAGQQDPGLDAGPSRFDLAQIEARLAGLGAQRHTAEIDADVAELRRELGQLQQMSPRSRPLPLIHGDLFRDNVLFEPSGALWLLDFESASRGHVAFDLAVTVLAWCFGDDLSLPLASSLIAGYASERAILPEEEADLGWGARLACLRFATTRITDYELRPAAAVVRKDYRRWIARRRAILALGENVPRALRGGLPKGP